uniref:RAS and EF-hand domain containing n=1 Tax=Myripristis murdjan TaxID=586833 RepID=A0A668AZL9_9TELE
DFLCLTFRKGDTHEQDRLRSLFRAYDVDNSGQIEKNEFLIICAELHVSAAEAERIFDRLDVDNDGTVTLLEFISGFHDRYGDEMEGGVVSAAWEDFETRLGDQSKFIPKNEQAAALYQNISLTEPRLVPQFERIITNFTKEIKQHHAEMENLALAVKRAQDQASMQLSEMEEEMDQRIHAAERRVYAASWTRTECGNHLLSHQVEEKYKNITVNDESPALKKRINELTLENQKIKHELMRSQTKVACLQSDMDSLKTELTDQSINNERSAFLSFASFCFVLLFLVTANRKLHDTNDGLRTALERYKKVSALVAMGRTSRTETEPLFPRRPSGDTMALAMCDPGLRRRHSSECEEDSLPESYMDSGLSTLRGSHGGYDSDQEVKGQEVEEELEEEEKAAEEVMAEEVVAQKVAAEEKAYRIVLAGDAAVGKSSFLLRLCKNEFKLNSSATLGVDFQMKTLIVDGEPALLQLWDTAGQERFRSIAKSYFRRADGVLLLYDVTCERSFLNVREWVDMIEDVSQDDIPIMLVGNKSDLRQEGVSCVPTSYGQKLAMTYNALFCETSAKDGSNVLEAVLHLAREVTRHVKFDDDSYTSMKGLSANRHRPQNFLCCT